MEIAELKKRKIDELMTMADELKISEASSLRKQELIFRILEEQAKQNGFIYNEGYGLGAGPLAQGFGEVFRPSEGRGGQRGTPGGSEEEDAL